MQIPDFINCADAMPILNGEHDFGKRDSDWLLVKTSRGGAENPEPMLARLEVCLEPEWGNYGDLRWVEMGSDQYLPDFLEVVAWTNIPEEAWSDGSIQ